MVILLIIAGGESYEILYSSLEPEVQEKLEDESIKSTAIVPVNNDFKSTFICESAKLTALARVDIVEALFNMRIKYKTKKEADSTFLDLYNSGMMLPTIYKYIGTISIGTLHRWVKKYYLILQVNLNLILVLIVLVVMFLLGILFLIIVVLIYCKYLI